LLREKGKGDSEKFASAGDGFKFNELDATIIALKRKVNALKNSLTLFVRRTFSRLFKEKFGLTPTEYRNVYLSEI